MHKKILCCWAQVVYHSFLTLALDEGEWSASRCSRLKPHRSPARNNYFTGSVGTETIWTFWKRHMSPVPVGNWKASPWPARRIYCVLTFCYIYAAESPLSSRGAQNLFKLTVPLLSTQFFNPLNAELNPICHLLALLGAHHILHVSRTRVNSHKMSLVMIGLGNTNTAFGRQVTVNMQNCCTDGRVRRHKSHYHFDNHKSHTVLL